jgi:hypothetical protein
MKKACGLLAAILIISSCGQGKETEFQPLSIDIKNENLVLFKVPKNGVKNLLIQDSASRRIAASIAELKQNRIFVLPGGDYDFSASGLRIETININSDCSIAVSGNRFVSETFSQVAFKRENNYYSGSICEGTEYYLTVLNVENVKPNDYNIEIDNGKGNIPVAANLSGNRVISAKTLSFLKGEYTITTSIKGDASKVDPKTFAVLDNDISGPELVDKTLKYFYRSDGNTRPFSFVMTDPSGIDPEKTWLEIASTRYKASTASMIKETNTRFRLDISVPQSVFQGRSDPIKTTLHMTDNDRHRDDDQSSRDVEIIIERETGFEKKIKLYWKGQPLKDMDFQVYGDTNIYRSEMPKRDYNTLNKSAFSRINITEKTKEGDITLSGLFSGQNITLFFTGQSWSDTVYVQNIYIANQDYQSVNVTMPSKGIMDFQFKISSGSVSKWVELFEDRRHYEACFYYKLAQDDKTAGTYNNSQVEVPANGFSKLSGDLTYEGDDAFNLSVNLDSIPKQNYFIYLVIIKYDNGNKFVMYNTQDELTPKGTELYLE